jgi:hypothetical protein
MPSVLRRALRADVVDTGLTAGQQGLREAFA